MSITLRELLQIPQIGNDVVAGKSGLDKPVVWAHACEMDAPWDWLGPDELFMTIGYCVPKTAAAQVRFVEQLAAAGIAGMAVGDERPAPRLSKAMLKTADDLRFPILVTGHTTPFSVIARAVASANQHEQLSRLTRLSRLSTALGMPARPDEEPVLARIAAELGHRIHVVDATYGTEILEAPLALDARVGEAIVAQVGENTGRLPARLHLDLGDRSATCFPVPSSRRPALLVVPDSAGHRIDPFAVLHVANLIAIELERRGAAYEGRRHRASGLLCRLVDGRLDSHSAAEQLQQFDLSGRSLIAVAVAEDCRVPVDLLFDRGVPHLMTDERGGILLLTPSECVSDLIGVLPDPVPVGTSDVIRSLTRVGDAVREARWAFETAQSQGGGHVDYASAHPLFLPRTVTEAMNAARTVLGALLDYDAENGTDLVRSLEVYLACDRSWKQAANVLQIHKQTLGYRLAQVEQLTGRRVNRTGDVAELWLALLAVRAVSEPGGIRHGLRRGDR
ncbi:PucR family transcriptional regulator [Streptomyces sp. NPDC002588]|uniref:PucR family transcriptional regulator n=1 Tax=Streptomyces sp. NPDC002588 TaxID=3154419 RepID=UPI0033240FC1